MRRLNRVELVGETMRAALEALAVAAPDWVGAHCPVAWVERYERRLEEYRLPTSERERTALATAIGEDGEHLLQAVLDPKTPSWLQELPAVRGLLRVWEQQYDRRGEHPRFRTNEELPPAEEVITSPYDLDARWGCKRETQWAGYTAQITESCGAGGPFLITAVATTPASTNDQATLQPGWADLAARDLLPSEHLVDAGYPDATALVTAPTLGITLIGPVHRDSSWQAREQTGYALADFVLDWERNVATCPQGTHSGSWQAGTTERGTPIVRIDFPQAACQVCPVRERCTKGKRRGLKVMPQAQHEARHARLHWQETDDFKARYAARAGVEGTISQAVRRMGIRRARYRGAPKVHLEHCAVAAAINLVRIAQYHCAVPRATTRRPHFTRAMAGA